ncbi:hypothetical protein [Paraliobacillus sediminis]|nr:hypothetical protein [Paraliobacillus sediminis]
MQQIEIKIQRLKANSEEQVEESKNQETQDILEISDQTSSLFLELQGAD